MTEAKKLSRYHPASPYYRRLRFLRNFRAGRVKDEKKIKRWFEQMETIILNIIQEKEIEERKKRKAIENLIDLRDDWPGRPPTEINKFAYGVKNP